MTFQAGTYGSLNRDGTFRGVLVAPLPFVGREGCFRPLVVDAQPAFDASTQKLVVGGYVVESSQVRQTWVVVALTAEELDAIADATERAEIKALREQIATDIADSSADQAQAQAYIDIPAPTNTQRNDEVLNSARRDKAAEQRFRRLARISRHLIKTL